MWRTSEGERVLQGAEAALFREGLGEVFSLLEGDHDGDVSFGAAPFDDLQQAQKLAVLAQVGRGLLCEEEPMPKLTAVTEATVAVIYAQVRLLVVLEIDDEQSTTWRQLVLDAFREATADEDDLPEADCEDVDEWDVLIECLGDAILWDEDWKDAELYLDSDPACSQQLKDLMGIDEDYYVDVPPDPKPHEVDGILDTLRELTGRNEPEFIIGIEDSYHDLLVGPCDEETAEQEVEDCRYVDEIMVSDEADFDCTYAEWCKHLREDVQAAGQVRHQPPRADTVDHEEIRRAQHEGLADGTRIVPRGDGWVVIDDAGFVLDNPETCTWVADEHDDDDEQMEPLVFPSPEDAYAAFTWSREVARACSRRREEALRRLAEAGRHDQEMKRPGR